MVAALTRPPGCPPAVVGSDSNGTTGDRLPDGHLHAPDPYRDLEWADYMVWQCERAYDEHGVRTHWVDRAPGDTLWSGGLLDVAALLASPFTATVGHWPTAPDPTVRDIDHVRVDRRLADAVCGVRVHHDPVAEAASDHLCKVAAEGFERLSVHGRLSLPGVRTPPLIWETRRAVVSAGRPCAGHRRGSRSPSLRRPVLVRASVSLHRMVSGRLTLRRREGREESPGGVALHRR